MTTTIATNTITTTLHSLAEALKVNDLFFFLVFLSMSTISGRRHPLRALRQFEWEHTATAGVVEVFLRRCDVASAGQAGQGGMSHNTA